MKAENQCESPMGGWWRECDLYNKDGEVRGMGVGKAIANVSYYNKSQGRENVFTYKMCEGCVKEYETLADMADDVWEDNVVTEIKWFDKSKQTEYFNREVRLLKEVENK